MHSLFGTSVFLQLHIDLLAGKIFVICQTANFLFFSCSSVTAGARWMVVAGGAAEVVAPAWLPTTTITTTEVATAASPAAAPRVAVFVRYSIYPYSRNFFT